jgi:hypothetical protein
MANGYTGRILHVDLTTARPRRRTPESFDRLSAPWALYTLRGVPHAQRSVLTTS